MNRLYTFLAAFGLILAVTGCGKDDTVFSDSNQAGQGGQTDPGNGPGSSAGIPEGYFRVVFSTPPETRAPITGQDTRVRDVRYLLFKSTGEFVKERHLVSPTDPLTVWPLQTVCDTLPKGSYRAVFLGNVEKTLFPYATAGSPTNYSDVLTGYQSGYSSGRILLPPAEMADNSEYYMANVTFSDAAANPTITMQRIISMMNLHRNFVDAQDALNKLVANIKNNVNFHDQISLQVRNILPGLLKPVLDKGDAISNGLAYGLLGGLDKLVSILTDGLVEPVTTALYNMLLARLVNDVGAALTGNTDQTGMLAALGVILNPWADAQKAYAVVTINDFPASINFDRVVQTKYAGLNRFKFKFTGGSVYDQKNILVKGFSGLYDIRTINVAKTGLLAGLVFDNTLDAPWLLNGALIDVVDPISFTTVTNFRYQDNYSFVDLKLKSYDPQTQSPKPLSLTIKLGSLPLLNILSGVSLLKPVLDVLSTLIIAPIENINVTVGVNLPLLGVDNLSISGKWDNPPTAY